MLYIFYFGNSQDIAIRLPSDNVSHEWLTFAQIVRDLNLPLYQSLPRVECENDRHVLANYRDRIGFFVESETALHPEKMLQAQGCFRLALLVTILTIPVKLKVQAVC